MITSEIIFLYTHHDKANDIMLWGKRYLHVLEKMKMDSLIHYYIHKSLKEVCKRLLNR